MRSIKNKGASGCNGGMIIVIIYIYGNETKWKKKLKIAALEERRLG